MKKVLLKEQNDFRLSKFLIFELLNLKNIKYSRE